MGKIPHFFSTGKTLGLLLWITAYLLGGAAGRAGPGIEGRGQFEGWLAGAAAGVLVRCGVRWWPAIGVGAFLAHWSNGGAVPEAFGLAAGHVTGALTVAGLLGWLGFDRKLARKRDIGWLALAALAGGLPPALAAAVPVCGPRGWDAVMSCHAALAWWGNVTMTVMVVTPVALVCEGAAWQPLRARWREFAAWCVGSTLVLALIFVVMDERWSRAAPVVFLPLLLVGWGALRFGVAGTALGVLLTALTAVAGTLLHLGPGETQGTLQRGLLLDWLHVGGVVTLGWLITGMLLDRQRAFDRLVASEAVLRLRERALEELAHGVSLADAWRRVTYVNTGFQRLTGYTPEDILGRTCRVLQGRDTDPRAVETLRAALNAGQPFAGEILNYRKNGTTFWNDLRVQPLRDESGALQGFVGVQCDVTERQRAREALKEREGILHTVLDHAPIGIWMQDSAGRLLFVNRAFCDAVGIPEERFVAVPHYAELFDPATGASCLASDRAALAGPGPHLSHERLRFVDGKMHDLEILKVRLMDEQGVVTGLIGLSLDITARRQAEAQMSLLGTALEAAANAILITNRAGEITWVNPAFTTLTGYTRAEALGRLPRELLHSGVHDREFFRGLWETILAGRVWQGQMINRRKDGMLYNEDQTITPLRDAAGEITHFIAIKQDVTQLTRARAELRASEARYRSLFENSPIPMYVYARDTLQFLAVNDTAVRHYGYSREEFLAMTIKSIRPAEDVAALLSLTAGPAAAETGHSGEWRHCKKDGGIITVMVESRPIHYEGRDAGFVVALDVTEKKQLQEQLLRSQRIENLGLLAAGIAHDLNNILTPLFIAVPLLREHLPDTSDQRVLGLVQKGADRGAALVRQILAFAHGGGEARHPVQLKHLARDIATMIEETFPRHIQFGLGLPATLWPVVANPTQIHQVMLNLCVNARDAMPEGGQLGLTLRNLALDANAATELPGARAGRYVVLEVSDTGTGITPEVLAHIWEPFFTTKQPDKGTGLGLSTVRGIISEHHGFCTVQTRPGAGTTFRIFLPAEPAAESADPGTGVAAQVPRGAGESLLVVDDESSVRTLVRVALVQQGYRVIEAGDGAEAIQLAGKHGAAIKAVITDIHMPRLGGEAVVAYFRQKLPRAKIIVMSGGGTGHFIAGDAYLPKPFTSETMLAVLHQLLTAGAMGTGADAALRVDVPPAQRAPDKTEPGGR